MCIAKFVPSLKKVRKISTDQKQRSKWKSKSVWANTRAILGVWGSEKNAGMSNHSLDQYELGILKQDSL